MHFLYSKLKSFSKNEWVILILSISIFFSVYAVCLVLFLIPIYLIATKQLFILRSRKKDVIFLSCFWVVSMITTFIYGSTINILLGFAMIFVFISILFITYSMTQRVFRISISLFCFLSVPCLLIALFQKALGIVGTYGARYSSVFSNPNYYALYLSLVIIFCIYNFFKTEHPNLRWVYLALIPINVFALYLTECRTAIIVTLIACPIILAARKKRFVLYYIGALALIALMLFAFGKLDSLMPRLSHISKDFLTRRLIWKSAFKSILDHPVLGTGYFSYGRANLIYGGYDAPHSHNLLLECLMNFGFLGSGLLFTYFIINIRKIIRLHQKNICHYRYSLTLSVIAIIILHGLFDLTMFWPQTSLMIIYVIGFSTEYDKEHIFRRKIPDHGFLYRKSSHNNKDISA